MQVTAQYDGINDLYLFDIQRMETLLNGKPIEKLMDRVMYDVGNSCYPIRLRVSPRLWITEVINYNEIKYRRQTCMQDWLEKAPSPELERYARFSEKNMANGKTFISSLYRDSFYNLYFRDIFTPTEGDEVRMIRWYNFPEREMDQSYLYTLKPESANNIRMDGEIMKIVSEQNGTLEVVYETGDKGEIRQIAGKIASESGSHVYIKQFSLKSESIQTIKRKEKT